MHHCIRGHVSGTGLPSYLTTPQYRLPRTGFWPESPFIAQEAFS